VNYGSAAQPWEGQCGYEMVKSWLRFFCTMLTCGYDFFVIFGKGSHNQYW